jgi:hypothetical protein
MMTDKAIPDPGRIFPTKPIGEGDQQRGGMPNPSQSFSSFMEKKPPTAAENTAHVQSPFALMQGGTPVATTPSIDTLLGQIQRAQGTSSDIQNQLKTPNLKLKASTKYLVKNKLSEATDHLRSLNTKIGAPTPTAPGATPTGPFAKFIGYLSDGQSMMNAAKTQLQNMNSDGTSLAPGDFLLVQLKMNKAQQLLEFSSVLLSSAVSDIKQFMQIQL